MQSVNQFLPWILLAAKVLLAVLVVAVLAFSQVARLARKRAYGPGGGRR